MEYTVDYFIEKFSNLTDEEVGVGDISEHCSLWHCGVRYSADEKNYESTEESDALGILVHNHIGKDITIDQSVYNVNDGHISKYQQPSARQRILACLHDIKAKQTNHGS